LFENGARLKCEDARLAASAATASSAASRTARSAGPTGNPGTGSIEWTGAIPGFRSISGAIFGRIALIPGTVSRAGLVAVLALRAILPICLSLRQITFARIGHMDTIAFLIHLLLTRRGGGPVTGLVDAGDVFSRPGAFLYAGFLLLLGGGCRLGGGRPPSE